MTILWGFRSWVSLSSCWLFLWHISSNLIRTLHPRKLTAGGPQKMILAERKRWLPSNIWPFWVPGTPKQAFINGCFNWMIPNLYIEHGCFTISIHLYMVGPGVPPVSILNFWGSFFSSNYMAEKFVLQVDRTSKESTFYTWVSMEVSNYPWTPKPWTMKVLNPQYMGYNPKNVGFGFPW